MAYPNDIVHNGFVNPKYESTFKETGLNDFDLATTRVYKGVKPMWEQLGFEDDTFDVPDDNKYWKNFIPKEYNFTNLSGIDVVEVPIDYTTDIGVSKGSKTPRTSYNKIVINEEVEQKWSGDYLYPILPTIDKYGNFEEDVNVQTSYGISNAPITNMKESSRDLVFDLDLNQDSTEDIIDKTRYTVLDYYKDFELFLDDDLRLQIKGKIKPDTIEKSSLEQAF